MARLRKVRDPSGRLIPFRQMEIAESIREAIRVSGAPDNLLADELAGVVTLFLEKEFDNQSPPGLSDIRNMILRVLTETGHLRIARAFGRQVEDAPACGDVLSVVRTATGRLEPFERERLVATLEVEAGLASTEARAIAEGVEERLKKSGLARIPTSLIREFADVELAESGLGAHLERHRILGVSRRDVESWLIPPGEMAPQDRPDPEERCAEHVLEAYAAAEIHSSAVMRAHRYGMLHIHGLGQPNRVEQLHLDASGPLLPESRGPSELLLHIVTLLQSVRPLVRRRVRLRRFAEGITAHLKRTSKRAIEEFVGGLLEHLGRDDVFGRSVCPPVDLEIRITADALDTSDDPAVALATRLLEALETTPRLDGRLGLTFVLEAAAPYRWPDSGLLSRMLVAARRHSGIAFRLVRDGEPESTISEDIAREAVHLDVGAVGINIPMILAGEGPGVLDQLSEALEGPLRLAMVALHEKYWFLRKSAPETLRGLIARLPGGDRLRIDGTEQGGVLQLWGLSQAVSYLKLVSNNEVTAPEILARLLAIIDYHIGEQDGDVQLKLELGGVRDRRCRARFHDAVRHVVTTDATEEFAEVWSKVPVEAPTLPLESPLCDAANRPVLSGRFLDRMGPGLPLPARGDDAIANGVWLRQLFESTRLGFFALEERGDVMEIQEGLFVGGRADD